MTKITPTDFQQTLMNAGYDPVWVDGLWGSKTANAASNWFASGEAIEVYVQGEPPPVDVIGQVVPDSWMPDCVMQRVHVHWTAGAYEASENDREHYHILVEGDGHLVRGTKTIKDNVSTSDGVYAAHTKDANTGAIGISACCMAGAVESPFNAGKYPLQVDQWDMLAHVAADLCRKYKISVTDRTVLQHGEVQSNLGIAQSGKWDICKLPWQPSWSTKQVGDDFRARVMSYL